MPDTALENEVLATDSVLPEVVETTTSEAPPAKPTENEEPKPISLEDAIKKAMDKHAPDEDRKVAAKDEPKAEVKIATEAEDDKLIDPITGRKSEPMKAPAGLTPALREKWDKVDPQFQKYWVDREREMAAKMNQTANERKLAGDFESVTRPYEAMLRQHGYNAVDHTRQLYVTSRTLHEGTPIQKAQLIDQMIRRFQPDIQTLVALANGNPMPGPTEPPKPINVQEEVQRVLTAREEAQNEQQAKDSLAAFEAKNEFMQDTTIRDLMAKAITAGFVESNDLPTLYQKAYDFALKQSSEHQEVLAARAKATPAPATPQAKPTAQVKPSLSGGRSAAAPAKRMSMDEAVKAAMAKHGIAA